MKILNLSTYVGNHPEDEENRGKRRAKHVIYILDLFYQLSK
jgi:hypothetical protein